MKMPMRLFSTVLAALAVSCSAFARPYVITAQGKKIEGTSLKTDDQGQLVLTTPEGQMTFPKGTKFYVDDPPEYDKAAKFIKAMQYDEAIRLLKSIIKEYRGLGWDYRASMLLPSAYYGKKDYANTVASCEALFKMSSQNKKDDDIALAYLDSLMQMGNIEKLKPAIDDFIPIAGRKTAAVAQLMRGNMAFNSGDYEKAVLDFMRTADFFRDVPDTLPEAIFKTAQCLEKLGDPRAAEYYNRLRKDFPASVWTAKIPVK